MSFGKLTVRIIGNSIYQNAGNLGGVERDAAAWEAVCNAVGAQQGYANIDLVRTADQTAAQMRTTITSLFSPKEEIGATSGGAASGEKPGEAGYRDTRVLIYAGHGAPVRDSGTDPDDPDRLTGLDAGLCGVDVQPLPAAGRLVLGDAAGSVIDDFVSAAVRGAYKLASCYVIYDCCYAGDSSRPTAKNPFQDQVRGLGGTLPPPPQSFAIPIFGGVLNLPWPLARRQRGGGADTGNRGLWMQACAWNETAGENVLGGFFSQGAIRVVAMDPSATPSAMLTGAQAVMPPTQHPQIEDHESLTGRPFLAGKFWA